MTTKPIQDTMEIIAEARSHFDASVSSAVKYSETPVYDDSVEKFWRLSAVSNAVVYTEKGVYSRYGDTLEFSPSWLEDLTVEDHRNIAAFVKAHRESFWAIDGLFTALIHQCISSNPDYTYLLRNFMLLWDDTTSHTKVESTEDCYSLHAISGIGNVDVSALPVEQQRVYRALAGFAVDAYLNRFYGRGHAAINGTPFVVDEIIYPGYYAVQEPYRSMVLEHPEQAEAMIHYLKCGYDGDELWGLLKESTPAVMSAGVL